jgi:uncharacterized protein YbjT (DUF2867 family)
MHTILGATGTIGRQLTTLLLDKGQSVKAIGRSSQKMQMLIDKGAQAAMGDAANLDFLAEAFEGADTVFVMIPPNNTAVDFRAYQNELGHTIARALIDSKVTHVVNLSSHGAHLSDYSGPIKGLYDQEQRLNAIEGLNILHLRPTYFMENLLMNIEMIKRKGINGGHIRGNLPFAMIATQDVARVASEHMLARNFSGKTTRELLGPRDISMVEATRIIGEKIGIPDLQYIHFTRQDYISGLVDAGLSPDLAQLLAEMCAGINDGRFATGQKRTTETVTPTEFEVFADGFAQIYNG